MILLEGPDKAGKSTLALHLSEALGLPISPKAVDPDMRSVVDIAHYIETTLAAGFQLKIFDRFAMISGPIYGAALGMVPPNDIFKRGPALLHWLEKLREVKPLVVYCLPPAHVVEENTLRSGTAKELRVWETVYWAYWMKAHQDLAEKTRLVVFHDYTVENPQLVTSWVKKRLEQRQRTVSSTQVHP